MKVNSVLFLPRPPLSIDALCPPSVERVMTYIAWILCLLVGYEGRPMHRNLGTNAFSWTTSYTVWIAIFWNNGLIRYTAIMTTKETRHMFEQLLKKNERWITSCFILSSCPVRLRYDPCELIFLQEKAQRQETRCYGKGKWTGKRVIIWYNHCTWLGSIILINNIVITDYDYRKIPNSNICIPWFSRKYCLVIRYFLIVSGWKPREKSSKRWPSRGE